MGGPVKEFFKGLLVGGDAAASMAKTMAWLVLLTILIGWVWRPEHPPRDLAYVLNGLLLYILGGKAAWTIGQGRKGNGKGNGHDHDHD